MRRPYVGIGATGVDPSSGGPTYAQSVSSAQKAECEDFLSYLQSNGLHALAAGLRALPHNNADYVREHQQLSVIDRDLISQCAYLKSTQLLEEAWQDLPPDEQQEHHQWIQKKLKEATKGKPGVAVYCPPGTSPSKCKDKIEAAIDASSCRGGFSFDIAPGVSACVPAWLLWGAGALVALSVYNAVSKR